MDWLLITAIHDNPGDAFVRIGVERLVRAVDPDASIRLLCKQTSAIGEPQPFDRAVWCGMPMFWSLAHNNACWRVGWWDAVVGRGDAAWIAADPRRFMVVGAGSFARWPGPPGLDDPLQMRQAGRDVVNAAWRVTARDPLAATITGQHAIETFPCPAVFAAAGRVPSAPGVSVCNLMPKGAHYVGYGPTQAAAWLSKLTIAGDILRDAGFWFTAHNEDEHRLARSLGWPRDRIVTDSRDPSHLLDLYAGAARYFGNRVHGAIAARGAGADVWTVGYDSRLEAVRVCGGRITAAADLDLDELQAWATAPPREAPPFNLAGEFQKQRAIFEEFSA